MKNLIAIAASLAINLAVAVAFQHSANEAVPVPKGEVTVTELGLEPVATVAQAPVPSAHADRVAL
jgi:hypothetical protein